MDCGNRGQYRPPCSGRIISDPLFQNFNSCISRLACYHFFKVAEKIGREIRFIPLFYTSEYDFTGNYHLNGN